MVVGASFRNYNVDTDSTLMALSDDDRSDKTYSVYGQVEFKLIPELKAVAALRFDDADLHDAQYSPKGALVFSPTPDHSIRVTYNQAFQVPNYSEFFLRAAAGAPANFSQLESGPPRPRHIGAAALTGVPVGQLYVRSSPVQEWLSDCAGPGASAMPASKWRRSRAGRSDIRATSPIAPT